MPPSRRCRLCWRRSILPSSATRAPQPPVVPAIVLPRRPERPLLLCDLAVPRDVDPVVGSLPLVELLDLDALRAAVPGSEGDRRDLAAARVIVDECVQRYVVEARERRAGPLLAGLRAQLDRQTEAELARTLA